MKAVHHPADANFWPWPLVVEMSAHVLGHPQLDVQKWFEEQVTKRTALLAEPLSA